MTAISGTTSNAISYEGNYEMGTRGRVIWTVTFRKGSDFCGMRNGQLEHMQDMSPLDLDIAVKAAVDQRWTGSGG
jgi:hypothetical protein